MPFDVILAGALGVSILLFALAGGADFGAGLWALVARRGERATEPLQLIERAIGPLWEANELWVVVSAVTLWSAFAPAFAAYGTRSEERRAGKECRSRWSPHHQKKTAPHPTHT